MAGGCDSSWKASCLDWAIYVHRNIVEDMRRGYVNSLSSSEDRGEWIVSADGLVVRKSMIKNVL
jgi:hypothetical protein